MPTDQAVGYELVTVFSDYFSIADEVIKAFLQEGPLYLLDSTSTAGYRRAYLNLSLNINKT